MNRALRALTALVTLWCLGCSSYEQLLAGLVGPSAGLGMTCDSESEMSNQAANTAGAPDDAGNVSALSAADTTSARGFACSCQSCQAASPVVLVAVTQPLPMPSLPHTTPTELLSVARAPLVPPPQRTL